MKTNKTISLALAALFSSSMVFADTEVSGKIIIEHAALLTDGTTIGNRTNSGFTAGMGAWGRDEVVNSGFTGFKDDVQVRLYVDGDVMDGVTYHAEIQAQDDQTASGGYSGDYTQNAGIRELYTDIEAGNGWAARLGKQQIVWGTADGMKLLDIINPTDYAEMAQNQMEDSRLPVWALNLEAGSVQVVISEPKENVFAGLNRGINTDVRRNNNGADITVGDMGTDTGNVYMMKGPDTITGSYNGFLNITPDLGGVATQFAGGFGGMSQLSGFGMQGFTVNGFENMVMGGTSTGMAAAMDFNQMLGLNGATFAGATVANADYTNTSMSYTNLPDAFQGAIINTAYNMGLIATKTQAVLNADATQTATLNGIKGDFMLQFGFASQFDTNLADAEAVGESQDTAFDYMQNTTFMTFDAFVNAGSQYVYNMPESDDVDFAIKTSQTTKDGSNFSLNFSNSSDKNPIINLSWRNSAGNKLVVNKMQTDTVGNLGLTATGYMQSNSAATSNYSLMLTDVAIADGATVSSVTGADYGGSAGEYAILRFEQTVNKAKNIGASFDTAIETAALGAVVVRGEGLYTRGSYAPVIDKDKLSYGDLVGALEMVEVDRLKFVLGVDITVLTNMMISGQYISDRNLDFVDGANRYTADFATMAMSNGFNKAIEDKQFYSLFFSKPFGASGQNRWNNIFMSEEGVGENGYWNRFDADFGLTDDVVATVEVNHYGGNANTQFGQLDKSDNMQVGVKYSF